MSDGDRMKIARSICFCTIRPVGNARPPQSLAPFSFLDEKVT